MAYASDEGASCIRICRTIIIDEKKKKKKETRNALGFMNSNRQSKRMGTSRRHGKKTEVDAVLEAEKRGQQEERRQRRRKPTIEVANDEDFYGFTEPSAQQELTDQRAMSLKTTEDLTTP